jgi:thymidylate kinase
MSNKIKKCKLVSLEGITYSGRIQLFNDLKEYYKQCNHICFIPEPKSTLTDSNCKSIYDLKMSDPEKYAFQYHLDRLEMMYKAVKNAIDLNMYDLIITEGSLYSQKAVHLANDVNIDNITFVQYQLYNNIFNRFANEIQLNGIIYVDTHPEICSLRNQLMNDRPISIDQLETDSEAYDRWLNVITAVPQLSINGTQLSTMIKALRKAKKFINRII